MRSVLIMVLRNLKKKVVLQVHLIHSELIQQI